MEDDTPPWGSEPVSGPGPGGGGGMIRELCRGFARYRRYLGRLRQNLRETQKFFRDIKCSHNRCRPSFPAGCGGAEPGPVSDVAEIGLPAGKNDKPERQREMRGRTAPLLLQNNPGKTRKGAIGPRGPASLRCRGSGKACLEAGAPQPQPGVRSRAEGPSAGARISVPGRARAGPGRAGVGRAGVSPPSGKVAEFRWSRAVVDKA